MNALERLEQLSRKVRELEQSTRRHPLLECSMDLDSVTSTRSGLRDFPGAQAPSKNASSRLNKLPLPRGGELDPVYRHEKPGEGSDKVFYRALPTDRRRAPLANQNDHQGAARRFRKPPRKQPWDLPKSQGGIYRRTVPMMALDREPCRVPMDSFSVDSCAAIPLRAPRTFARPSQTKFSLMTEGCKMIEPEIVPLTSDCHVCVGRLAAKNVRFSEKCTCDELEPSEDREPPRWSPRRRKLQLRARSHLITRSPRSPTFSALRRTPLRKKPIPGCAADTKSSRNVERNRNFDEKDIYSTHVWRLLKEVAQQRREESRTLLSTSKDGFPPCPVKLEPSDTDCLKMCPSKSVQTQPPPVDQSIQTSSSCMFPANFPKFNCDLDNVQPDGDWWEYQLSSRPDLADSQDESSGCESIRKLSEKLREIKAKSSVCLVQSPGIDDIKDGLDMIGSCLAVDDVWSRVQCEPADVTVRRDSIDTGFITENFLGSYPEEATLPRKISRNLSAIGFAGEGCPTSTPFHIFIEADSGTKLIEKMSESLSAIDFTAERLDQTTSTGNLADDKISAPADRQIVERNLSAIAFDHEEEGHCEDGPEVMDRGTSVDLLGNVDRTASAVKFASGTRMTSKKSIADHNSDECDDADCEEDCDEDGECDEDRTFIAQSTSTKAVNRAVSGEAKPVVVSHTTSANIPHHEDKNIGSEPSDQEMEAKETSVTDFPPNFDARGTSTTSVAKIDRSGGTKASLTVDKNLSGIRPDLDTRITSTGELQQQMDKNTSFQVLMSAKNLSGIDCQTVSQTTSTRMVQRSIASTSISKPQGQVRHLSVQNELLVECPSECLDSEDSLANGCDDSVKFATRTTSTRRTATRDQTSGTPKSQPVNQTTSTKIVSNADKSMNATPADAQDPALVSRRNIGLQSVGSPIKPNTGGKTADKSIGVAGPLFEHFGTSTGGSQPVERNLSAMKFDPPEKGIRTATKTTSVKHVRKVSRATSGLAARQRSEEARQCDDSEDSSTESCESWDSRERSVQNSISRFQSHMQGIAPLRERSTQTPVLAQSLPGRVAGAQTSFTGLPVLTKATSMDIAQNHRPAARRSGPALDLNPQLAVILEKIENVRRNKLTRDQSAQTSSLVTRTVDTGPITPLLAKRSVRDLGVQNFDPIRRVEQIAQTVTPTGAHRGDQTVEDTKKPSVTVLVSRTTSYLPSELVDSGVGRITAGKSAGTLTDRQVLKKSTSTTMKKPRSSSELFEAVVQRLNDLRLPPLITVPVAASSAPQATIEVQTDTDFPAETARKILCDVDLDSDSSSSCDDTTTSGFAYSDGEYIQNPNAFDMMFVRSTKFDDTSNQPIPKILTVSSQDYDNISLGVRDKSRKVERSVSVGEFLPGQNLGELDGDVEFTLKRHRFAPASRRPLYPDTHSATEACSSGDLSSTDCSHDTEFGELPDFKLDSQQLMPDILAT